MTPPRFAVLAARFNAEITDRLLDSCLKTLAAAGVAESAVEARRVPGAFELPWAAQELARSGRFDAVICLGAVIKGKTPQNHYISESVVFHLHAASLSTGVPCILGVVSPATVAQGLARTRGALDRGREAALAALEMAALRRELRRKSLGTSGAES